MNNKNRRMRVVTLLYKKTHYRVHVHCVPRMRHLLRLRLNGVTEPLSLEVQKLVYDCAANGRTQMVEIHLRRPRRPLSPVEDLKPFRPPFHAEFDWPSEDCPPCIWDSVQLRQNDAANRLELKVFNVIHDIDQTRKTHTIKIQVFDARPQRVFSDEDIQRAFRNDFGSWFPHSKLKLPEPPRLNDWRV
jgi:hypothetical protein